MSAHPGKLEVQKDNLEEDLDRVHFGGTSLFQSEYSFFRDKMKRCRSIRRSGACRLSSSKTSRAFTAYETPTATKAVASEIDRLLEDHTYGEIPEIRNEQGYESDEGRAFDMRRVSVIRRAYGLMDRYTRHRLMKYSSKRENCFVGFSQDDKVDQTR